MSDYNFVLPIYGVIKPTKKSKNPSLNLNWYRNAHYRVSNDAKKKFKRIIRPQLDKFDAIEGQIKIHYVYYAQKRGTDLDNFIAVAKKFFQDALTEHGLIIDDNCDYIIKNSEAFGGVDKHSPRVEAFITLLT